MDDFRNSPPLQGVPILEPKKRPYATSANRWILFLKELFFYLLHRHHTDGGRWSFQRKTKNPDLPDFWPKRRLGMWRGGNAGGV